MTDFNLNKLPHDIRANLELRLENKVPNAISDRLAGLRYPEKPVNDDEFTKVQKDKDENPIVAELQKLPFPLDLESLMPFNDNMSKGECYGKGMYDLATQVKLYIDKAKAAKESQSYMYWGAILEGLIDNLEHLTHGILIQKIKK